MGAGGSKLTFILSMTTTPSRLGAALEARLLRLVDALPQNFDLVLNVPWTLKRDGDAPYPEVPSGLTAHPRVHVVRLDDQGPITKLLPTLRTLVASGRTAARMVVIVLDDDIVYPPAYVCALAAAFRPSDLSYVVANVSEVKYGGLHLPQGYRGYGIPMAVVTHALLDDLNAAGAQAGAPCFTSDDFVVGRALAKHGVAVRGFSLAGVPYIDMRESSADPKGLMTQDHAKAYRACDAHMRSALGW